MNTIKRREGTQPADFTKLRTGLKNLTPAVADMVKNFVPYDRNKNENNRAEDDLNRGAVPEQKLKRISDMIANNINAMSDLRVITPYISQAELIWRTLLLSPNGMQPEILRYDTVPSGFKNAKLHSALIAKIKDYYTNSYKIEDKLPDMITSGLITTGAYIILNISRPALDNLINGEQVVAGTEHYRTEILKEFIQKDNKLLLRNKGAVRDPKLDTSSIENINGMEALFKGIPNPAEYGYEFDFTGIPEMGLTITDNQSILSIGELGKKRRADLASNIMGGESFSSIIQTKMNAGKNTSGKKPDKPQSQSTMLTQGQRQSLVSSLYPDRAYQNRPFNRVRTADGYSLAPYGEPLRYTIPPEACIILHAEGDVRKKRGAVLLIDRPTGTFLRLTKDPTVYLSQKKAADGIDNKNQSGSNNDLIANLRRMQNGEPCDFDMSEFAELNRDIFEKGILSAIVSGTGEKLSLNVKEETEKMMLSRMFKHENTCCLYVPEEALTYIAFDYDDWGFGRSMTSQAKMYIARLAALDFADAVANLELAQPHVEMTVDIEEEDPEPLARIYQARARHFAGNPTLHGMVAAGIINVPDIADAIKENSLTVKINAGENKHIPAPGISFTQVEKVGFKVVDKNSRDNLLNNIANTYKLQKSWLDVTEESSNNFKTEALAEEEMLRNTTITYQNILCGFIDELIRKDTILNRPLIDALLEIIMDSKDSLKPDNGDFPKGISDAEKYELILVDFLNTLYTQLPVPSSTESLNKIKDKLDIITTLKNAWLEASMSSGMAKSMLEAMGVAPEKMSPEQIEEALGAYFMMDAFRMWNIPTPFDEIVKKGKEGGVYSLINSITQFQTNVGLFISEYAQAHDKVRKDLEKTFKKAGLLETMGAVPQPGPGGDPFAAPVDGGGMASEFSDDTTTTTGDGTETPPVEGAGTETVEGGDGSEEVDTSGGEDATAVAASEEGGGTSTEELGDLSGLQNDLKEAGI